MRILEWTSMPEAERALDPAQHRALDTAIETVRKFHAAQSSAPLRVETAPGVVCERISVPVRAVGLYVPAGSAPLPSTAVMLAVPAAIAGCLSRVMCTAPTRRGGADPAVLVAARKAGIARVFKVGGAQAIAAMACGTATISGLSLEDFQKRIKVQELTPAGLRGLRETAQILARLEGLDGHAAAVGIRLAALAGERA